MSGDEHENLACAQRARGGRIAASEARIVDGRDKIYAHATATCLIVAPHGA